MVRIRAWAALAALLVVPLAGTNQVSAQVMAPFEIDAAPSARLEKAVDLGGPYAAIPPDEILRPGAIKAALRAAGYTPVGTARLQGTLYRIGAISADGEQGRVVVDGRSGEIMRFIPASADYGLWQRPVPRFPVPRFREAGPIPRPPRPIPRLASRTIAPPLPTERPVAAPAAPAPASAARAADPVVVAKPAPVPPPAPEAKPAPIIAPTEPMPPVQGLD